MTIETGYIYHIKDDFFKKVNDSKLMSNHENGNHRPTYFTIKDNDILWFIPLSSKIEKYKKEIEKKTKKYGSCRTIMISKIANRDSAILLQNAFPITEKYIDHIHLIDGNPLKVTNSLKNEILDNFKFMLSMKKQNKNLFFADVDKIKLIMLNEI